MTELFERAIDRVRSLPNDLQDEVARMVLSLAGDGVDVVPLTPEEDAAVRRSMEAAARGEFATDDQLRAVWAR